MSQWEGQLYTMYRDLVRPLKALAEWWGSLRPRQTIETSTSPYLSPARIAWNRTRAIGVKAGLLKSNEDLAPQDPTGIFAAALETVTATVLRETGINISSAMVLYPDFLDCKHDRTHRGQGELIKRAMRMAGLYARLRPSFPVRTAPWCKGHNLVLLDQGHWGLDVTVTGGYGGGFCLPNLFVEDLGCDAIMRDLISSLSNTDAVRKELDHGASFAKLAAEVSRAREALMAQHDAGTFVHKWPVNVHDWWTSPEEREPDSISLRWEAVQAVDEKYLRDLARWLVAARDCIQERTEHCAPTATTNSAIDGVVMLGADCSSSLLVEAVRALLGEEVQIFRSPRDTDSDVGLHVAELGAKAALWVREDAIGKELAKHCDDLFGYDADEEGDEWYEHGELSICCPTVEPSQSKSTGIAIPERPGQSGPCLHVFCINTPLRTIDAPIHPANFNPLNKSILNMPFDVFTRWRPLLNSSSTSPGEAETVPVAEAEITRAHDTSPGKNRTATSITPPPHLSRTAGVRPWKSGPIFNRVFEATEPANNRTVFDAIVAPVIPRVLAGQTANFLAYGHSGSGKSHTIIGYEFENEDEFGLCLAAGRKIFDALERVGLSTSTSRTTEHTDQLGVGLSMYELRGNTAFDLLHPGHDQSNTGTKTPCHIRSGPDGKTHIRGETETFPDGRVRVRPIAQRPCWTFNELREALLAGLELRATGTSTIHDQSSRTHAVLELEIVTGTLLDARDAVIERQSELVPVAKRATDIYIEENMKGLIQDETGTYVPNPEYTINQARIDEAEGKKAEFEIAVTRAEEKCSQCESEAVCPGTARGTTNQHRPPSAEGSYPGTGAGARADPVPLVAVDDGAEGAFRGLFWFEEYQKQGQG
ncbi:kinesin family protein [Aspergillus mulundensis]|uniref:Kinesin motor domain-containing protein n=1 Tax=Aspergillus mulundensis TaxID=1810919 RepID=A0A3D8T5F0_9EURO|nr:hypothetical protein DSM5745_00983 [Aspergillus mulundensis]RDW93661.1 hypothetical protein DSM5745_00983 [Aspergillus mulundensis]